MYLTSGKTRKSTQTHRKKKKQGKHDVIFMLSTRFKRREPIARVRRENRCVTDRATCIICKARCETKLRDLLFTKLAESFLLRFPVHLSTSHGVFYLLFNVALSWESRDLTAPPRNCSHRVLPNSSHPAPTPPPPCRWRPQGGCWEGQESRCLSVCPGRHRGGRRRPPPETRLQAPPHPPHIPLLHQNSLI